MSPQPYRKKPIVVEAMHFVQYLVAPEIAEWIRDNGGECLYGQKDGGPVELLVTTLEGTMTASVGDYIIKGIKGEFYPCKPDVFEATYDAVPTPDAATDPDAGSTSRPAATGHIDKPFAYHKPSEDGLARITALREAFSLCKAAVETHADHNRERSLAITNLEQAAMWAIKGVVFNDPKSEVAP